VRCRACECVVAFAPVSNRAVSPSCDTDQRLSCPYNPFQDSLVKAKGVTCPMCAKDFGTASLQVQLECQIREHINKYYESWTVCDDPTCGNRARMMGVYGRRCLKEWCRGSVTFEVGPTSRRAHSDELDTRPVFGCDALQPAALFSIPL
jgi:DNA polymerase alpha subunit A